MKKIRRHNAAPAAQAEAVIVRETITKGTIKWFDNDKGHGYIVDPTGGDDDIFLHYKRVIDRNGERITFEEGEEVLYILGDEGKGPLAVSAWKVREEVGSD